MTRFAASPARFYSCFRVVYSFPPYLPLSSRYPYAAVQYRKRSRRRPLAGRPLRGDLEGGVAREFRGAAVQQGCIACLGDCKRPGE